MQPTAQYACLAALAVLLTACSAPQRLEGSGEIAPTPWGHAVACAKDPSQAGCPK